MRFSTLITTTLFSSAAAFAPNMPLHHATRVSPLAMSTEAVNYVISGNNIEVTDSLSEYVEKKLDKTVGKLAGTGAVQECDVHLTVNKNPKVCDNVKLVAMIGNALHIILHQGNDKDIYRDCNYIQAPSSHVFYIFAYNNRSRIHTPVK